MSESEAQKRKMRVRKVAPPTKPHRHVVVARRVPFDPLKSGPVPGSLEADFLLEDAADLRPFLSVQEPTGPRYYQQGKVVPYTVVGPTTLFDKVVPVAEAKPKTEETATKRRASLLRVNWIENPEQRLREKLQKIEEGKHRDAREEATRRWKLSKGLRIIEDSQSKSLGEFKAVQKAWNVTSASLASKVCRPDAYLAFNRLQQHREKVEDIDLMDRAIAMQAKTGPHAWYLSLRGGEEPRGNLDFVGNLFSGIYPQVKDRPQSAGVIIRKPGSSASSKSLRDSHYFQQRMKEVEMKRAAQQLQPKEPSALSVCGVAKFPAITAGTRAGRHRLLPPRVDACRRPRDGGHLRAL